jgi:prolyl 4-hydroxylase
MTQDLLAKAAAEDQRGDHNAALMTLVKATELNDPVALTQLGKRLLFGDRAPRRTKDGAALLLDAAEQNHPEAVAAMAILQSLGIHQQQSWENGLRALTHAAKLGWLPARDQLLIMGLAVLPENLPELLNIEESEYWEKLAGNINLREWLTVPKGQVLNASPMIVEFPNFLPQRLCRMLMSLAAHRLGPSELPQRTLMRNYNAERSTYGLAQFGLLDNDFIHCLLQERIARVVGLSRTQLEGFAVHCYRPGEEFSEHVDYYGDDEFAIAERARHGQRVVSFFVYLNDNYEEGATYFPSLDLTYKGREGAAIYVVNADAKGEGDPRSAHVGLAPKGNMKWLLSQYFRSQPLPYLQEEKET